MSPKGLSINGVTPLGGIKEFVITGVKPQFCKLEDRGVKK